MSALGTPVLINANRAYWLSSIANDVTHSTITTQEIDAGIARFSTVYVSDFLTTSTLNASSFKLTYLDLSEANVSTLRTNNIYTSSQTWASDLSGGVGYVRISTDASGVQVDGDPIRFDNLVYFTSTITLVPVSTIVDTDIFSQNGYFSTLSSGSISAGQIQANTASLSTLTVSSITTTDISGFSPTTWSLYPTLNSSITFNGPNVLSNIGNKLYFAGTELTDVSGGGQGWSQFPATTDVSMNNFSIRQLSTLQYQDGARLYSQTGNNLFYNGQPISYGTQGNNANWAGFPASTNVNMAGYGIGTTGNLPIVSASNITINSGGVSTVVDQGLNIATTANFDVTVQNGNRGIINLTANGGNNNGLFGTINLTANGASLAGVGSGGLINITANTPAGFCNLTSAVKINGAGVNSYAGVIPPVASLAGYNFIYGTGGVNICAGLPPAFPNIPFTTYLYGTAGVTTSSDFYVPNIYPYWNGVTTPPDLFITGRYIIPNLAQVYVQMCNVKNIYMQGSALIQDINTLAMSNTGGAITNLSSINGQNINTFVNQSNILASNVTAFYSVNTQVVNTTSTIVSTLVNSYAQVSSFFMGNGLILSTTIGDLRFNNAKVADDITGVTNAPMPLQSRILNFSTINSFNVSTTDLWVSSINGQPIDISGNPFVNTSKFSTIEASSIQVSSLTIPPGQQAITVQNPLRFATAGTIENIFQLNTDQLLDVTINANKIFTPAFNFNTPSISTQRVSVNNIKTSTIQGATGTLDISSNLIVNGNTTIPQANGITFNAGGTLGTGNLVNTTMPCVTNFTGGLCNLGAIGANQYYIGSGTGAFGASKLYCDFPGDNWGVDIIDANGSTLFETINCYDTGGVNFQTNVYGVSSITGYTANTPGAQQAVGVQGILTADQMSTTSVKYTSTLEWYNSNTNFNFPIRIEQDTAGNSSNAGVAISIKGHDFGTGAVQHELLMGYRSFDGANFITAVWQGQNLEDLVIEGEPVTITDGIVSTIFNTQPFAMQTTGGVKIGGTSAPVEISTNLIKVGGQTNLTEFAISSTYINTPYGNNFYTAGQRQPCVFHGTVTLPSGGGVVSSLINLPANYTTKDFDVNLTYKDQYDNSGLHWSTQTAGSFLAYGGSSKILSWASFGDLPFTG